MMIRMPPTAPANGLNALVATVTTPPPSGLRHETSMYFEARRMNPSVTNAVKTAARSRTSW